MNPNYINRQNTIRTRILRIELYRLLESFLVFRILIVSRGPPKMAKIKEVTVSDN